MPDLSSLSAEVPAHVPNELFETLLQTPVLRIERIISRGHCSPPGFWYDQDTDEWVLQISGAARLQIEGELTVELSPGSFLNIPAHQRHRVEWTDPSQPTVWLAVHYRAERQVDDADV